jgi:hypothetical protein
MLSRARWSLSFCLLLVIGCAPIVERRGSRLAKPCMSADSVVLEIYSARFNFNDPKYNESLWRQVDEQPFPPDLRRTLGEYGFRAGVLQGQIPVELQELMTPSSGAPSQAQEQTKSPSQSLEEVVVDFEAESPVRRRILQLRAAKRGEILASGVYESLPLLENEGGQLRGKPYARGQGLLSVKSFPQPDGRVRLDLLPELHHGDPKISYVGNPGIIRVETGRAKKIFEQLALSATLSPGEMLLVTSLPSRPGSLGHYFFTEQTSGALQQKLLLIRLAQTQHNDLFGSDVLVVEE